MSKKWQCRVCMHEHEGEQPPETCPVCGAPSADFSDVTDEQ